MGITVGPTYITEEGFEISPLYLCIANTRIIPLGNGNSQVTFIFEAYKSRKDKKNNRATIALPYGRNISDIIIETNILSQRSLFDLAYTSLQEKFQEYVLSNVFESGQTISLEYKYNPEGYDINGFNSQGYNASGYNVGGYNSNGYNIMGYNINGYDLEGYTTQGYNSAGFSREGYNSSGYNGAGYDINGYDIYGFNAQGLSMNGGYNYSGYLPDGSVAPLPSTIIVYNSIFPGNQQSFNVRIEPAILQSYIQSLSAQIAAASPPDPAPTDPPQPDPETIPPA